MTGDNIASELGFGKLDDTVALVFREGDDLHSFVGDYGPTDEEFRRVARNTTFRYDGTQIIVEGDFNGHVVYHRIDRGYHELYMMTWVELVEECTPVAENWIEMPDVEVSADE